MTRLLLLMIPALLLAGCRQDTNPVPHRLTGEMLYRDYRKQPPSFPLPAKETNAVLVRTDLKSTGDYQPVDRPVTVRFIYGGKYYWAYETPRRAEAGRQLYGPFRLP
jgi:hypothetical protein